MKILVLNGSPKGAKSDVMHITRAFLDGINEEKQHDIHVINIIYKHIEYCTGCFACMHHGGTCIHDDDMKEMLEEILESDLLILSFPLYCYGMPAPLKAFMDRTLPLSSMAMASSNCSTDAGRFSEAHLRRSGLMSHTAASTAPLILPSLRYREWPLPMLPIPMMPIRT